jgi:hypothetical protein
MAADSVAVNHPKILPPMMMNGVIKAGIETKSEVASAAQLARG